MCSGSITDRDEDTRYQVPNIQQFSKNNLSSGYCMGFVTSLERALMSNGIPLEHDLVNDKKDVTISSTPLGCRYVVGFVEKLAAYMKWNPSLNSKTIILFHGKCNVPHIGHYLWIENCITRVTRSRNIQCDDVLPIILCERNEYISSMGKKPFMNTAWRDSIMFYLTFSGIVVPGDEIVIADAEEYWNRAYLQSSLISCQLKKRIY